MSRCLRPGQRVRVSGEVVAGEAGMTRCDWESLRLDAQVVGRYRDLWCVTIRKRVTLCLREQLEVVADSPPPLD